MKSLSEASRRFLRIQSIIAVERVAFAGWRSRIRTHTEEFGEIQKETSHEARGFAGKSRLSS